MVMLKRFFYEEDGQGMVEYGLIIALIDVVVIGVLTSMGGGLKAIFTAIQEKLVVPTS
jgi:pilus assembly protein Flp/PilA